MKQALHCLRCEHVWVPKSTNPTRCPSCKSLRWDRPDGMRYRCSACGFESGKKVAVSSHIRFTNDDGGFNDDGTVRSIKHGPYGVEPHDVKIEEIRPEDDS